MTAPSDSRDEAPPGHESPAYPVARTLEIVNKLGLHSRPAAKFAATVDNFDAAVLVSARGGEPIDGSSILDLLMLGAGPGCCITVEATGPDAAAVVEALAALVGERFGEDE